MSVTRILHQLKQVLDGVKRRARVVWFRSLGVRIDGPCWLQKIEIAGNFRDVRLARGVALDRGVTLLTKGPKSDRYRIEIGESTYINRFTVLDAAERIEIGPRCMIGPHCTIIDNDHGKAAGVPVAEQALETASVILEEGVWLGANVVVLKGVRIGAGAVVGAGSVVTRDVEREAIVVGVPARPIGVRTADSAQSPSE